MEEHFKVGLKELTIRCNGVDRTRLVHDWLYWRALGSAAVILRIPYIFKKG
jgi:hypothetical protein